MEKTIFREGGLKPIDILEILDKVSEKGIFTLDNFEIKVKDKDGIAAKELIRLLNKYPDKNNGDILDIIDNMKFWMQFTISIPTKNKNAKRSTER